MSNLRVVYVWDDIVTSSKVYDINREANTFLVVDSFWIFHWVSIDACTLIEDKED